MGKQVKVQDTTGVMVKKLTKKEKKRLAEEKLNQKKALAALIQQHPHLWRLEHPDHSNQVAVNGSWVKIGVELGVPGKIKFECQLVLVLNNTITINRTIR